MTNLLHSFLFSIYILLPFSHGFKMDRTSPGIQGHAAFLWCSGSQDVSNGTCLMKNGERELILHLSDGRVTDQTTGELQENYESFQDGDTNMCGLRILDMNSQDFGQWVCKIELDNGSFQQGFASLLSIEQGFVKDIRLPDNVLPEEYDIKLTPYILENNYTIEGESAIRAVINQSSDFIYLHSKYIAIEEDSVGVNMDGFELNVLGFGYDLDRDFFIVYLEQMLEESVTVTVTLKFQSILNDDLTGFYRSTYFDPGSNTTKMLAATDFEPISARRAFPCFDEPALKAKFRITLGRKREMISLSNMPMVESGVSESDDDEYILDVYQQSVKMSTYLVAFIICEFNSTSYSNGSNIKVWAKPDSMDQVQFAAEVAPKLTSFYEELFGVDYALPKLDMVAVPDFQWGAMENWGLITFRDANIFYNEKIFPLSSKETTLRTIAHEISHQWFGNLVTMKWWNDLWLNEGFATFISFVGGNFIAPEMNMKDSMINMDNYGIHDVFALDALNSSAAISGPIENPEFEDNATPISYGKGCALLRMVENFLTSQTFYLGLKSYFDTHSYGNAEMADLWNSLEVQGHIDGTLDIDLSLNDIMDSWTLHKGFPVIHVEKYDLPRGHVFQLRQEKFNLEITDNTNDDDTVWFIPVSFAPLDDKALDPPLIFWMNQKLASIPFEGLLNMTYLFNLEEMGFYRVNYDNLNWQALADRLVKNHLDISRLTRAQLIDDSLNLARAQLLNYEFALNLTGYLRKERDYIPWLSGLKALKYLDRMFRHGEDYDYFRLFAQNLMSEILPELVDYEGGEYMTVKTRELVMSWSCYFRMEQCIEKAKTEFSAWSTSLDSENFLNPNDKSYVYCNGIRYGDQDDWNLAWERLQVTTLISERDSLLLGLACASKRELVDLYLEKSISSNSSIRSQDKIFLYRAIGQNMLGGKAMLEWLGHNWEQIRHFYGGTFVKNVQNMITGFPEDASTPTDLELYENLLADHRVELGSAEATFKQGVDKIKTNIKWKEALYQDVVDWLPEEKLSGCGTKICWGYDGFVLIFFFMILQLN